MNTGINQRSHNVPVQFVERRKSNLPVAEIIRNYLIASEGRIDGISGYQDNFSYWHGLRKKKIKAVLWGDEVYGWKQFDTFQDVRSRLGIFKLSEYQNIPKLKTLGLKDIRWPENLEPLENESPCSWSGRIYQDFRVPLTLSARVDCKSRFVEIINPLMTNKLIYLARLLPDHLREYKRLAVKVITELSPDIPFNSSVTHDGFFRQSEKTHIQFWDLPETVNYINDELNTDYARSVLPEEFINFLLGRPFFLQNEKKIVNRFRNSLSKYVPPFVRRPYMKLKKRKRMIPTISLNLLAFRALIIIKMKNIFETKV